MCSSCTNSTKWMFIFLLLIISNITHILSKKNCKVCDGECRFLENDDECTCKRTTLYEETKRWDQWSRRYEIVTSEKLHTFITCENMNEESLLVSDLCPDDCKYITFHNNHIKTIPFNSFKTLPNIREIYMNDSRIENIQTGSFSGLSHLEILQLENNRISSITKGCLNSLIALKSLDLHNNLIDTIEHESFLGLTFLEILNLSFNNISVLSSQIFSALENLKDLSLSHNFLKIYDLKLSLTSLEKLDLSYNEIYGINESFHGTQIKFLYFHNNRLSDLNTPSFPSSLQMLDLHKNEINRLNNQDFENLNKLSILDLSVNQIRNIPIDLFKDCTKLELLKLMENRIEHFETGVFSGLQNLIFLNISNIKITNLDSHTLLPLTNLRTLDIANNDLKLFDLSILSHFVNLETIYMNGNQFSCSVVASVMSQSKIKNFSINYKKNYSTENINGLPCKRLESHTIFKTTTDMNLRMASEKIINLFENMRNFSLSMETTFNNIYKEFIEKINVTNYIKFRELSKNQDEKFGKILAAIENQYNRKMDFERSALKDEIILLKKEESINSASENSIISMEIDELRKLDDSIYEIKIFIILFCALIIVFYVFTKIRKYSRAKKDFRNSHELPVIVDHNNKGCEELS